jgi:hypothetical protein
MAHKLVNSLEKHNSLIIVTCMSDRASNNNLLEVTSHLCNQAVVSLYRAEMLSSFVGAFEHLCNCKSSDPGLRQYIHVCCFDAQ